MSVISHVLANGVDEPITLLANETAAVACFFSKNVIEIEYVNCVVTR